MTYYSDLTTLSKVREWITVGDATSTTDDALLVNLIRSTSQEIEQVTHRKFSPYSEVAYCDTPIRGDEIVFDADLLDLTTFTNGDTEVITSTNYKLYPLRGTPKYKVKLINGYLPQKDSYGNHAGAISVDGIWGYHSDYPAAWSSTTTLSTSINASITSLSCPTGKIVAGDLLRIDDEYLYASAVTVSTSDTVTVARAVNGTTAATHSTSAEIDVWQVEAQIEMLARTAVVSYYRLRANPIGETVMVNGSSFATQRNVKQWLTAELRSLGLVREGIG